MKHIFRLVTLSIIPLSLSSSPIDELYNYLEDDTPTKAIPESIFPYLPKDQKSQESAESEVNTLRPLSWELYSTLNNLLETEIETLKQKKILAAEELKPIAESTLRLVRRSTGLIEGEFSDEEGQLQIGWRIKRADHTQKVTRFDHKLKETIDKINQASAEKRKIQAARQSAQSQISAQKEQIETKYTAQLEVLVKDYNDKEETETTTHQETLRNNLEKHKKTLETNCDNQEMTKVIKAEYTRQLFVKEEAYTRKLESIKKDFEDQKQTLEEQKDEELKNLEERKKIEDIQFSEELTRVTAEIQTLEEKKKRLEGAKEFWGQYYKTRLYEMGYKTTESTGSYLSGLTRGFVPAGDPFYWVTYTVKESPESSETMPPEGKTPLPAHLTFDKQSPLFPFKDFYLRSEKQKFFMDENNHEEGSILQQLYHNALSIQKAYDKLINKHSHDTKKK
jgi:hypothetical protein